jgi:hypothetical protein
VCSHPIHLFKRTDMLDTATGELAPLYETVPVLPGAEDSDVGGVHGADEEPGNSGGLMVVVPGLVGEVPG